MYVTLCRYSDTNDFNNVGTVTQQSTNTGYLLRKQLFCTGDGEYKQFAVHFVARLNTDFMGSTNALLIPGVDVRIDIMLNSPALYMMSNTATDSESK